MRKLDWLDRRLKAYRHWVWWRIQVRLDARKHSIRQYPRCPTHGVK